MRQRDEALLARLLSDVSLARARVRDGRKQRGSSRVEQQQRCARLADAMEAYAQAAHDAGIPVPYRYRDELRLYRQLGGPAAPL